MEVICEDTSLADYLNEAAEPEHFPSSIRLHEGGGLCGLLSHMTASFAFAPPLPEAVLREYHLVQKKYQGPPRKMTDMLIYPQDARLSRTENAFLVAGRLAAPGQ